MSEHQPSVMLIIPSREASFVRQDEIILKSYFTSTVYTYEGSRPKLAWAIAKAALRGRADVIVAWFIMPSYALVVAMMAKWLRRKLVFITGGTDVDWIPQLNCGAMGIAPYRKRLAPTLRRADMVLAFSTFSAARISYWAGFKPKRLHTLYFGIDNAIFTLPPQLEAKQQMAVTVCAVMDSMTIRQKGVDTFVAASNYLPHVKFVVVGKDADDGAAAKLKAEAPANVNFVGRVSDAELVDLYQTARVYVQMSAHEGFGVAVAEAMCCGCIPVTTDSASYATSMPEVVGDYGYTAPYGNAQAVAEAISKALMSDVSSMRAARQQIVNNFPPSRRERELSAWIRTMVEGVYDE